MSTPYDVTRLRPSWVRKITIEKAQDLIDGDCWIWTGASSTRGGRGGDRYGRVAIRRRFDYPGRGRKKSVEKTVTANTHRTVYELLVGPIPEGLQLDHLCRITLCCNPNHLEPVTAKVNCERGVRATRTHCPQGHPYSGENLRTWTDKRGYTKRVCRACGKVTAAQWRAARASRSTETWAKYLSEAS